MLGRQSHGREHIPRRTVSAHLWDVNNGSPVLMETDDVDACLAAMCARTSERYRQEEDTLFWQGILEELPAQQSTDE